MITCMQIIHRSSTRPYMDIWKVIMEPLTKVATRRGKYSADIPKVTVISMSGALKLTMLPCTMTKFSTPLPGTLNDGYNVVLSF
jgi:hypothetical protein